MDFQTHTPAYKRYELGDFSGLSIKHKTKYRPSVTRDLSFFLKEMFDRYKLPFSVNLIPELVLVILFLPFVFAFRVWEVTYVVSIEKAEWNIEHSKFVVEKKQNGESFLYPEVKKVFPLLVSIFWSATAFLISSVASPFYIIFFIY